MNNYLNNSIYLETIQLGAEIKLGPKSDKLMAELLNIKSTPAPSFSTDDALTVSYLEEFGCIPFVHQDFKNKFFCVFNYEGEIYATKPYKFEAETLAYALYFILTNNKSLMTRQGS